MLTNLLASHPAVCLIGETHHVFKGHNITDSRWRVINKCLYHDAPILMRQGQNFFSPRLVKPRKSLSRWSENLIDRILYREKLRSNHPLLNQYKTASLEYTRDEIVDSRLLCKNIDGMIYGNDAFRQMYPDATYFGLVRNGFAICEGHVRRGRSAEEIGWRYKVLAEKMLADADRFSNCHMVRFEDLVADPMGTVASVYGVAGLDVERLGKVRMQVRRVMDANGNHQLVGDSEWDVVWLTFSELSNYFNQDVNLNQIKRLTSADRDAFLKEAGSVMERLGYTSAVNETQENVRESCVSIASRKRSQVAIASRRAA